MTTALGGGRHLRGGATTLRTRYVLSPWILGKIPNNKRTNLGHTRLITAVYELAEVTFSDEYFRFQEKNF